MGGGTVTGPLIAVVGATASGKSDLALALAERMPVEIVVADSRQVYRGMDVGTAKPDAAVRARVAHHLIDLVEPTESFTVADWVRHARALVPSIHDRGARPLVVGGTGLYVNALVDGHDYRAGAPSDAVRAALNARLERDGLEVLAGELERRDPTSAARTDMRNPRRVIRALERLAVSGVGHGSGSTPFAGPMILLALDRPRDILGERIERRARAMFEDGGLPDEVRGLLDAGVSPTATPMSGIGYREAAAYLAGERSIDDAIAATARRTRQYAKRQLTWLRARSDIDWLRADDRAGDDATLVDEAEAVIRSRLGG